MDKIWYRNPSKSEIIGRCGGDEKTKQKTGVEGSSCVVYACIVLEWVWDSKVMI